MTKFSNKTPKEAKKASDAGSKGGKATWSKPGMKNKKKRFLMMQALVARREELRAKKKKS